MASPKYEYYTITLDTVGQASANTFTCFLAQPIHNVVHARLSAAHIKTTEATEQCYVSIEELNSNFSDHTSNVYEGQPSMTGIRNTFASLVSNTVITNPTGNDTAIVFKDEYTVETYYSNPIRTIDRFRVKIFNQNGELIKPPAVTGNNFLVIRFTCLIN
jgi:hypothetical protein